MGFWKRFWKDFVGSFKKIPEEEDKWARYEPGGLSKFIGKDMGQVKNKFRGAFGNNYDNENKED